MRHFVDHRHEVTIRRTKFDLKKAQDRAHILEALIVACDNIDEVVHLIRDSKTPQEAIEALMRRFDFDEVQARAIVDMRLRQLTGLQMEQLRAEYEELMKSGEYEPIKGIRKIGTAALVLTWQYFYPDVDGLPFGPSHPFEPFPLPESGLW